MITDEAYNEYKRLASLSDQKRTLMLSGKVTRRAWYMACNKASKAFHTWWALTCADDRKTRKEILNHD